MSMRISVVSIDGDYLNEVANVLQKCAFVINDTCVILMEPEADLSAQAIALMKEWGPVHAGCSAGDFGTIDLTNAPGWVVTSSPFNISRFYVSWDAVMDYLLFFVRGKDASATTQAETRSARKNVVRAGIL